MLWAVPVRGEASGILSPMLLWLLDHPCAGFRQGAPSCLLRNCVTNILPTVLTCVCVITTVLTHRHFHRQTGKESQWCFQRSFTPWKFSVFSSALWEKILDNKNQNKLRSSFYPRAVTAITPYMQRLTHVELWYLNVACAKLRIILNCLHDFHFEYFNLNCYFYFYLWTNVRGLLLQYWSRLFLFLMIKIFIWLDSFLFYSILNSTAFVTLYARNTRQGIRVLKQNAGITEEVHFKDVFKRANWLLKGRQGSKPGVQIKKRKGHKQTQIEGTQGNSTN